MNGKENIIAKIIESAENSRKKTLFEANEKIKQIETDTKTYISALNKKTDAEIIEMQKNTVLRRKSVADLDVKKIILKAKHTVLDASFSNAESKVLKLSDNEYKKFIKKLITNYSENNDIVIASNIDKKRIDKSFIDDISKTSGLKLGLEYSDNFNGGIILQSKNCNKNLTLVTLMKQIREEIESEVATILF